MLTNITGIYRGGKVEFKEFPMNIPDETQVVVTFIGRGHINLQARGINQAQAEELRSKLTMFAEDWDSPEMSIYDDFVPTFGFMHSKTSPCFCG